ncbi:MAG TPA: sugar phosphate nucleotidyltransferase [Acidimicrobiales bacterium]|nr:sugar phosphate nucleotidyltransferase [Acidimicrobiales bacterium]
MQCLVLAGGLGTRMHPATRAVPKCLIEVGGRPFAHWQLEWLASEHVENVVYSIGHLGELVRTELGDGSRWGISITYVDEGGELVGTGGAVRLAVERGAVDDEFFVLYGDSYLSVELAAVEQTFHQRDADALMTVYRNHGRWEVSNAVFADGVVTRYEKGLSPPPPDMQFVDYGLSALRAAVVLETVPTGRSDLADAFTLLSRAGRLAGFEATERFFEIGTPSGLADLERRLTGSADEAHRGG